MEFQLKISDVDKLEKTFSRLPNSTQRKAYLPALREGAKPVRIAATNNIKEVSEPFTGLARRSDTLRIYKLKNFRGNFRVAVQVKRGLVNVVKKDKEGKPVRVGMYLAVLEYGSQKLNRAPRSWIRKALKEKEGEAVQNVRSEFFKRMNSVIIDARSR
jgi:HK97 gp10 family phage protein